MHIPEARVIWMDGQLVPWADAQVHVLSHALHYGTGVLEGTRVYATAAGPMAFRLEEHVRRLERSARMLRLPLPYDRAALLTASSDLVRENDLTSCYLRHAAFFGYGVIGLDTREAPVRTVIAAWEMGSYLGAEGERHGITLGTSSWRRSDPNAAPTAAKATGPYLNSVLAKREALESGYDEALLLNRDGYVAECSAENVFVIRDGAVLTPPSSAGALEGITADSVRTLAADLGHRVEAVNLLRSDLYAADEVFVTGTAAGIVPVRSLDRRDIGGPGPVTERLRELLNAVTAGEEPRYKHWLTPVG
ncbi:branched-chain amino acid transaminase [Streptomyces sp. NPDC003077]|uniref:branched-chain amino acid transaminase n=1 Tax=Streptomyces sp. NPDC003077 TaxID=3154443 RepID=UPI00339E9880